MGTEVLGDRWSAMVLLLVLLAAAFWMWWRVIPSLLLLDEPRERRAHHDPLGDSLRLRAAAVQQVRIERRIERAAPKLVADVEHFLRQQADSN